MLQQQCVCSQLMRHLLSDSCVAAAVACCCRAVAAGMRVRQPHNHTTSVADIEGAAPADRDKVRC